MLVTPTVAELCSLLIDEFYGELPSRIFSALLTRGRSNIPQLAHYTSMNQRQLRHGLAVLLQYNLLFYTIDFDTEVPYYEANPENAYSLIRNGKILEMIDTSFGAAAKDVMQSLLLLGQTRIGDLVAAYQEKIDHANKVNKAIKSEADEEDPFAEPNGVNDANGVNGVNGDSHPPKKSGLVVKSTAQLNSVICRLIEAELIDVVHDKTFRTPEDILKQVEEEVNQTYFPNGVKGKAKIEQQEKIAEGLRKIRGESKSLKRKLEQNGTASKRRKLFMNGAVSNGSNAVADDEVDPVLDPKQVIRINYERCLVDLRNRRLVQHVTDTIGETTAYVYGVLLKLLTKALPRCRLDPMIDISEEAMEYGTGLVTTDEILDSLKTSVDLSLGIGKVSRDKFSSKAAEKTHENPPKKKVILEADVDGTASADEDESNDGSDSDESVPDIDYKPEQSNGTKVKFAEGVANEPRVGRPAQLRQHLLLLSESNQRFVRHCGHNDWTVDFVPLMRVLREGELDSVIEQHCGRQGLRLVRILRAKGKLDEKALPNVALMRKSEIQQKMLQMQTAGFVHTQEVPRDNKADVKKSFFLWFCDVDKSLDRLLETSYKTMLRCIQVLEVRRQKEKDVLRLTRRTDVRGREKDVMRKEYYDRYSRFQEHEKRLFAQIMRIDELVALIRDF